MPHTLILGMTSSGKTTAAKQLLKKYQSDKRCCLVLDPLCDPSWNSLPPPKEGQAPLFWQTDDPEEFLDTVFQSKNCSLFVDEAGDAIGRYSGVMGKLATRSRHLGHNAHFIAQRASMLDKTIRDQCEYLFLFRVSKKDAEVLADEFCKPDLEQAAELQKGEMLLTSRFSETKRLKVF